jgi:hypothetical protein
MNNYLRWGMAVLAIVGAALVTATSPEYRFIAFAAWIVSNGYLLVDFINKKDYPLVAIYIIYEVFNVIGVINNWSVM